MEVALHNYEIIKFIYSEKATKFCEISTVDLSQNMNFKKNVRYFDCFVVVITKVWIS